MLALVGDLTIVKTKGAPPERKYGRKRRECSTCKKAGHTIRKYPLLLGRNASPDANKDSLCLDSEPSTILTLMN